MQPLRGGSVSYGRNRVFGGGCRGFPTRFFCMHFYRCFLTCSTYRKNWYKINFWGTKMHSAAEWRGWADSGLAFFEIRLCFWRFFDSTKSGWGHVFYRCFLTCAKPCKYWYKIHFWGKKMDSAAEGRPLAIFGRLRSSLFASRIRFWHSFCTFLGYVGRRILCAGACPRSSFLCLGSTPESVFYAQVRVPGVIFSNLDFCRNAMAVIFRSSQSSFAFLEVPLL